FLASLVALFSRTSLAFIERRVGADLRLTMHDPRDESLEQALSGIDGVDRWARAVHLRGRSDEGIAYDVVAGDLVGMKHLWVVPFGVDPSLPDTIYLGQAKFEEGDAGAFRKLAEDRGSSLGPVEGTPPAIVSLSFARHLDVGKGDLVRLSFRLGSERRDARVRIEAVCSSLPGFSNFRARSGNAQGSGLLLSKATFERLADAAPREAFTGVCFIRARGKGSEAAAKVREELGLRHRLGVECAEEEKREAQVLYWATQILFSMLLSAAVMIALFGLVASMATAVLERRWEVGVLKAVGLRRGHLYRMFAAEAVAITLSSGLLGAGMGFLLAWLFVVQAAVLMEIPVAFTMPWITLVATFAVCAAAGLVASWLPTRRILRRPVAEILRATV
ncbi:MAG: ABC transporter permease, partial [Candidatus Rokuibacteriota bacterium]